MSVIGLLRGPTNTAFLMTSLFFSWRGLAFSDVLLALGMHFDVSLNFRLMFAYEGYVNALLDLRYVWPVWSRNASCVLGFFPGTCVVVAGCDMSEVYAFAHVGCVDVRTVFVLCVTSCPHSSVCLLVMLSCMVSVPPMLTLSGSDSTCLALRVVLCRPLVRSELLSNSCCRCSSSLRVLKLVVAKPPGKCMLLRSLLIMAWRLPRPSCLNLSRAFGRGRTEDDVLGLLADAFQNKAVGLQSRQATGPFESSPAQEAWGDESWNGWHADDSGWWEWPDCS